MFSRIKKEIQKSAFIPNFFSLFHHSFITRRGIYRGIIQNKQFIGGKVLDFGCGEKPYKNLFQYDEYIGVDFEKTGHDNTKNEIDFFWDGKKLPFQDNEFDSILVTEVLEHIFYIDEVLIELKRVLKPGGFLLVTIPFVIHEHEVPYDFARYTQYGISFLLEKHGFCILKNEQYGNYFDVILQLHIWFLGKISETKYFYWTLLIRIFFVAPIMIFINILSFLSPKMQKGLYLNNIIVGEKK